MTNALNLLRPSDAREHLRCIHVGTTSGKIVQIEAATARVVESIAVTSGWGTALSVSADDDGAYGTSEGELQQLEKNAGRCVQ